MTPHAHRIAGLLRDHAADLRARADRIDALAAKSADITIDDIDAELRPSKSHALSTIARLMIDAARER